MKITFSQNQYGYLNIDETWLFVRTSEIIPNFS